MLYMLDPKTLWAFTTGKGLKPHRHVVSIADLSVQSFHEMGVRGLIFDVDNTLTRHAQPQLQERIKIRFEELCISFPAVIFSNCGPTRHEELGRMFSIPVVESGFKKPQAKGFQRAADILQLPLPKIAMIGDRVLTDILGANRLGMHSVLVDPFDEEEPAAIAHIRALERWRLALLD